MGTRKQIVVSVDMTAYESWVKPFLQAAEYVRENIPDALHEGLVAEECGAWVVEVRSEEDD